MRFVIRIKKIIVIVVLLVLVFVVPACHKEMSVSELISGSYFDWYTGSEMVFAIDNGVYHTVDIHNISTEDIETSRIVHEKVYVTEYDDKRYVEQGSVKDALTYYLIQSEKPGLYLLVPHYELEMDYDFARPLGFCLRGD